MTRGWPVCLRRRGDHSRGVPLNALIFWRPKQSETPFLTHLRRARSRTVDSGKIHLDPISCRTLLEESSSPEASLVLAKLQKRLQ
jgi:hypothetical protein